MLNETFLSRLEQILPVSRQEPMSRHTTLNIGGRAAAYVSATDACALRNVLRLASVSQRRVIEQNILHTVPCFPINASCSVRTAWSAFAASMTTEILISDVEII